MAFLIAMSPAGDCGALFRHRWDFASFPFLIAASRRFTAESSGLFLSSSSCRFAKVFQSRTFFNRRPAPRTPPPPQQQLHGISLCPRRRLSHRRERLCVCCLRTNYGHFWLFLIQILVVWTPYTPSSFSLRTRARSGFDNRVGLKPFFLCSARELLSQ